MQSGDWVMMRSCNTNAVMVANPNEKMVSSDAYALTATCHNDGPCARSVMKIEHADP